MARILIVDDEPSILQFLKLNLELDGHDTILAGDGEEALEVIESRRPDIVLLDLMMPILDGWEVLRRVGGMSLAKRPRVIVMTASGGGPNQARGMALGADDYLTKPLTIDKLRDVVEVVLKRSDEESQKRRQELLQQFADFSDLSEPTLEEPEITEQESQPQRQPVSVSPSVIAQADGSVFWITLSRPEALNAFNDQMGNELLEALSTATDPTVRCVVITGAGDAFCAGEDLKPLVEGYSAGADPKLGEILRRRYIPIIEAIQSLDKPVIAAINGAAAGAGVSLALACDDRIMADDAALVLAFSRVGLVPDSGATWFLPRYLGIGRAMSLTLYGERISPEEALNWGLVSQLCPRSVVRDLAKQRADRLAAGPTAALARSKKLLWAAGFATLMQQMEAEAQAQAAMGRSADHIEGMRAFFEKRKPQFGAE